MNIFIAGGTGFVGRAAAPRLIELGHAVTLAARGALHGAPLPAGARALEADLSKPGEWQAVMASHDCVVNLAGASIFTRWTASKKAAIRESRVSVTKNVVDALSGRSRVRALISASAVGYYGFRGDVELAEDAAPGDDFLAGVCRDWEREALNASPHGVRAVIARLGVVLGRNGGALGLLEKIYRLRLGNRLGPGGQWFSWIHVDDLASALVHVIDRENVAGAVNFTSPNPVTNREFTRAMNLAMGTFPLVPPAPGFALRLAMGEFGDFLLKGQRAVPRALLSGGFDFAYPGLDAALENLVRRAREGRR